MFRVFGHEKVWVLDGGLPKWHASGYGVESSASSDAILKVSAASEAVEKIYQGQTVSLFILRNCFANLMYLQIANSVCVYLLLMVYTHLCCLHRLVQ